MDPELEKLLVGLRRREAVPLHGVSFARSFLADVESCLAGGECPPHVEQLAKPEEWAKRLKEADDTLVYVDPGMEVKKYTEATSIPNCCLEFTGVLTSVTRDRDGDVLDPRGAKIDPKMPLLWQHMLGAPIGKHLEVVSQNRNRVLTRSAIADIPLGRDAATLVKFGALRISHGFLPTKWEPIWGPGQKEGEGDPEGYHFKEFNVLEKSLVSVPSNPDACIVAYSREKLHHPLVKRWAKGLFDTRQRWVKGGWGDDGPARKPAEVVVHVKSGDQGAAPQNGHGDCTCGGVKSLTPTELEAEYATASPLNADDELALDGKPLPQFHACRLLSPAKFEKGSFRTGKRKHDGKSYDVIYGRLKGETTLTQQSFRYAKATWTKAAAEAHCKGHKGTFEAAKDGKDAPGLVTKSVAGTKGLHGQLPLMMAPVEDSWEEISWELESSAGEYLQGKNVAGLKPYDDVILLATFSDHGIVCSCDMWGSKIKTCWKLSWDFSDGEPAWTGDPEEVEVTSSITEKAAAVGLVKKSLGIKEPGVAAVASVVKGKLSRKHVKKIEDANGLVKQVRDDHEAKTHHKALLGHGANLLDDVLQAVRPGDQAATRSVGEQGRELAAAVALKGLEGLAEARAALGDIQAVVGAVEKAAEADAWAEVVTALG